MVVSVFGGAVDGVDGYEVRVEVDAGRGLPVFHMVGLPNTAVRESRERVMSAVRNCGLEWPKGRVVVNLAPAEIRKEGASLDLAVAVGVLAGGGRAGAARAFRDVVFLGELSLSGDVEPVRGVLAMVMDLAGAGHRRFVVPSRQRDEARLVPGVEVVGATSLREVGRWLDGSASPDWRSGGRALRTGHEPDTASMGFLALVPPDTRRLAMTAAAGRHSMLLVGPPGCGKTRLCRAVGALQPELRTVDALEVLKIAGALAPCRADEAGPLRPRRPFRAPHHSVTRAGLIGGGSGLRPGEATLAHRGILFLDELTEFPPGVLDALREPLEEGHIVVARGGGRKRWPADVQLLAAMNPCRCGWLGSGRRPCSCQERTVARHRDRLSGPFLDRLDLFCELDDTLPERGAREGDGWNTTEARDRIVLARRILGSRNEGRGGELAAAKRRLDAQALAVLDRARESMALTVRSLIRCARVSATLAALDGRERAGRAEVVQALQWRREATLMTTGAAPLEPPP